MKALLLALALALSLFPITASAQTTDLTNFQSHCSRQANGTSIVSGSFDLSVAGPVRVQERGYNFQSFRGRNYSKVTYFGTPWTLLATEAAGHYTFTMPPVSAYLTYWRMQQGALLYIDSPSFLDTSYSPALPITLVRQTGNCT